MKCRDSEKKIALSFSDDLDPLEQQAIEGDRAGHQMDGLYSRPDAKIQLEYLLECYSDTHERKNAGSRKADTSDPATSADGSTGDSSPGIPYREVHPLSPSNRSRPSIPSTEHHQPPDPETHGRSRYDSP